MTRLSRAAVFGLLWLVVSSVAFSSPLISPEFDLADDDDGTIFPGFASGDTQMQLQQWCQDPASFVTMAERLAPDPSIDEALNVRVLPGVQPLDLSEGGPATPVTLALSGGALILLGLVRRRRSDRD
jgi:hypothetical protein